VAEKRTRKWGLVGLLVGIQLACGGASPEESVEGVSEGSGRSQVVSRASTENAGTRLSVETQAQGQCRDARGGDVEVSGTILTTGSVDSVEVTASLNGGAQISLATVSPQSFEHNGREKTAAFSASIEVPTGAHDVVVCLTQSGAKGRDTKKTCTTGLQVEMNCSDDQAPISSVSALPLPNAAGWNKENVNLTFSANDGEGVGVEAVHVRLSGAQVAALRSPGAQASANISAEGVTLVTYWAVDKAGNTEAPKVLAIRLDRTAPVVTFHEAAPAANSAGWNRSDVSVPFAISDALSGVAGADAASPLIFSSEGIARRSITAVDAAGNSTVAVSPEVRIDRTPPTLSGLPAGTCLLRPPNHQQIPVAQVVSSDALSGPGQLNIQGTSSEPDNGLGDGDTSGDIAVQGGTVQLRAERSGKGTGRTYSVSMVAEDAAGNSAAASFQCSVGHDQGSPSASPAPAKKENPSPKK